MVDGSSPVKLLVYEPNMAISVVIELAVVGLTVVLQHTPLDVIIEFPLLDIFPPETAVVVVMEETEFVIIPGKLEPARVVNEISEP